MFPFNQQYFDGNAELATLVNLLIYIVILLGVPSLFVVLVSTFKPKIKPVSNFYLYAFSAAIFVMIGSVGLIGESFENAREYVELAPFRDNNSAVQGIAVGITAGGAFIGLSVAIFFRFIFIKRFGELHHSHDMHGHSDHIINPLDVDAKTIKASWLVIFLILSHRMIDGFILGGTVVNLTNNPERVNVGFVVTFNIHILVETLIIYYRQVQYGQKRWRATLYNFFTTLVIVPVMFFGAYIHPYISELGWFIPVVNASGGAIITFVGIIEIVPEFIHFKNMGSKQWYKVIIWFAIGLVFALILLSFHNHGHSHNQNIEGSVVGNQAIVKITDSAKISQSFQNAFFANNNFQFK
ncbi:ZIP family metal transporter [[Mycoplasma] testudinis]|uniref:hypothetical protein n=1 Tax=[Mycoplasma] testudinis TaxID=33924 RepID=UPI0006982F30|nr:hypothetical protein [[Mycoplasma] testudinis]